MVINTIDGRKYNRMSDAVNISSAGIIKPNINRFTTRPTKVANSGICGFLGFGGLFGFGVFLSLGGVLGLGVFLGLGVLFISSAGTSRRHSEPDSCDLALQSAGTSPSSRS